MQKKHIKAVLRRILKFSLVTTIILFALRANEDDIDALVPESLNSAIQTLIDPSNPPAALGIAPQFTLTTSNEGQFASSELIGKVWVVNYFHSH